jgi:hypothetical protein
MLIRNKYPLLMRKGVKWDQNIIFLATVWQLERGEQQQQQPAAEFEQP